MSPKQSNIRNKLIQYINFKCDFYRKLETILVQKNDKVTIN